MRIGACGVVLLAGGMTACDRSAARVRKLEHENERLRAELRELKEGSPARPDKLGHSEPAPDRADLDVTIDELWAQRFEDNKFRAKQRLDGKRIRVTGAVSGVSAGSFSLLGRNTRFGTVEMKVQMADRQSPELHRRMAELETGTEVTVEGNFLFDRMWLVEAAFVNTGRAGQDGSKL